MTARVTLFIRVMRTGSGVLVFGVEDDGQLHRGRLGDEDAEPLTPEGVEGPVVGRDVLRAAEQRCSPGPVDGPRAVDPGQGQGLGEGDGPADGDVEAGAPQHPGEGDGDPLGFRRIRHRCVRHRA